MRALSEGQDQPAWLGVSALLWASLFVYLGNAVLAACCAGLGWLPWGLALRFAALQLATFAGFAWLDRQRGVQFSRRPSTVMLHMWLSFLPGYMIGYAAPHAVGRVLFMFQGIAALMWAVVWLSQRRFLQIAAVQTLQYLALLAALAHWHPERFDAQHDPLIALAWALCNAMLALLGGHVYRMRMALRARNQALLEAMQRIAHQAAHDELTGLFNRRHAMQVMDTEVAIAQGGAGPLCVGLIDLDHFKSVNDDFGHPVGDEVLIRVARELGARVASPDVLTRFGGEELLVIMPGSTLAEARTKIDALRTAVAAINFALVAPGLFMSLSAGVAQWRAAMGVGELLAAADQALYRAKNSGRNRVECAT